MLNLTQEEKRAFADTLAQHLSRLRKMLGATQAEFGELCGFSRTRVSQIENGAIRMTWSQCTSILYICTLNRATSEYLFAHGIYTRRILQFFQNRDESLPPDMDITVRSEVIERAFQHNGQ